LPSQDFVLGMAVASPSSTVDLPVTTRAAEAWAYLSRSAIPMLETAILRPVQRGLELAQGVFEHNAGSSPCALPRK